MIHSGASRVVREVVVVVAAVAAVVVVAAAASARARRGGRGHLRHEMRAAGAARRQMVAK